jgi:hypothetical protein
MKSTLLIMLITIGTTVFASNKDGAAMALKAITEQPKELVQPWSFEEIAAYIKAEFPEAYDNFTSITFTRTSNYIYPDKATFLIPSRFFRNKLKEKTLKDRTDNVLEKMGNPGSCHEVSVGESTEYAWHEWEDKIVTPVTIHFYIGC